MNVNLFWIIRKIQPFLQQNRKYRCKKMQKKIFATGILIFVFGFQRWLIYLCFVFSLVYSDKKPEKPKHNAKTVSCNIEHNSFRETRITRYRLKKSCVFTNSSWFLYWFNTRKLPQNFKYWSMTLLFWLSLICPMIFVHWHIPKYSLFQEQLLESHCFFVVRLTLDKPSRPSSFSFIVQVAK